MENLSDQEIIKKIKNGEINYYEFLVRKYSPKCFFFVKQKVGNQQDAEDIVQNSFVKAYQAIDNIDEKKEFFPYFYSIVRNEIAQFYRENPKNNQLYDTIVDESNRFEDEEKAAEELFKNLKGEYRTSLELYAQGFSYKEIAEKMKKPLNTIKTIIRRAKMEMQYER